jgi:hypothetical protein
MAIFRFPDGLCLPDFLLLFSTAILEPGSCVTGMKMTVIVSVKTPYLLKDKSAGKGMFCPGGDGGELTFLSINALTPVIKLFLLICERHSYPGKTIKGT